jgi:hypothetical protein
MLWIRFVGIAIVVVIIAVAAPKVVQARDCGLAGWIFGCDQGPTEGEIAAQKAESDAALERERMAAQERAAILNAQTSTQNAQIAAQSQQTIAQINAQNQQIVAGYSAQVMQALAISNQKMIESTSMAQAIVANQLSSLQSTIVMVAIFVVLSALIIVSAILAIVYGRKPLPRAITRHAEGPTLREIRHEFGLSLPAGTRWRSVNNGVEVEYQGAWRLVRDDTIIERTINQ